MQGEVEESGCCASERTRSSRTTSLCELVIQERSRTRGWLNTNRTLSDGASCLGLVVVTTFGRLIGMNGLLFYATLYVYLGLIQDTMQTCPAPTLPGQILQIRFHPSRQKHERRRFRSHSNSRTPSSGPAVALGRFQGQYQHPQKQLKMPGLEFFELMEARC
jgi:hypothetical protein